MKTTFKIQNLKCGGCSNTISKKLYGLNDVTNIEIDNDTKTVSFYSENINTAKQVHNLLNNLGYPVIGDKNNLTTKAKSFVSCAIGRI